jgi:hypothetical protein
LSAGLYLKDASPVFSLESIVLKSVEVLIIPMSRCTFERSSSSSVTAFIEATSIPELDIANISSICIVTWQEFAIRGTVITIAT